MNEKPDATSFQEQHLLEYDAVAAAIVFRDLSFTLITADDSTPYKINFYLVRLDTNVISSSANRRRGFHSAKPRHCEKHRREEENTH